MRKIFLVSLIFILTACIVIETEIGVVKGSGTSTSESRDLAGVRTVILTNQGDLTIKLGERERILIEGDSNLIPYIITELRSGELIISTEDGVSLKPVNSLHYTLTVKSLEALQTTSSGDIDAPALQADGFAILVSSSGDIQLDGLTAETLTVKISSSGGVKINSGKVDKQSAILSSSGEYTAPDLESRTADVNLSSSGEATIWVIDRLIARLSSSGDLKYYGDPRITESTSSSGRLRSMGNK